MGPASTVRATTGRTQETSLDLRSRRQALVEVMGFEPTTSSMRPKRSSQLSYTPEWDGQLRCWSLGDGRDQLDAERRSRMTGSGSGRRTTR